MSVIQVDTVYAKQILLAKILPMLYTLYCEKNFAEFNFSNCTSKKYIVGGPIVSACEKKFTEKIFANGMHRRNWRNFPCIRYYTEWGKCQFLGRGFMYVHCVLYYFSLQGVVGTSSGSVWYINWSDVSKVKLISGHTGEICNIAFTRDGIHFASCSLDGLLSVWSVESLEQIVAFQASRKSCTCLAFAPSQVIAAIGSNEKEPGQVSPSDVPDLVAGYSDGTVRVFNIVDVKMARKMQPHAAIVRAVMYSFDGESNSCLTSHV